MFSEIFSKNREDFEPISETKEQLIAKTSNIEAINLMVRKQRLNREFADITMLSLLFSKNSVMAKSYGIYSTSSSNMCE